MRGEGEGRGRGVCVGWEAGGGVALSCARACAPLSPPLPGLDGYLLVIITASTITTMGGEEDEQEGQEVND
jgi:hypothetical protein